MKARMTRYVPGERDGKPWPGVGEVVDLPAEEAKELFSNGNAEPVDGEEPPVVTGQVADTSKQHGRSVVVPVAPGDYPEEHHTAASSAGLTDTDPGQAGNASHVDPAVLDDDVEVQDPKDRKEGDQVRVAHTSGRKPEGAKERVKEDQTSAADKQQAKDTAKAAGTKPDGK